MKIKYILPLLFLSHVTHAGLDEAAIMSEFGYQKTLITENKNNIEKLKQDIEALKSKPSPHMIGEQYKGGIIFWLDEKGEHGLIASLNDLNNQQGIAWRNGVSGNKTTNARADGIGSGETNTRLIIAQQTIDKQNGAFAALLADNYQVLNDGVTPCKTPIPAGQICYGGWYLPSAFELQLMHENLYANGFANLMPEPYWSSTESSVANAWLLNFATGELETSSKSNAIAKVRAVSRF